MPPERPIQASPPAPADSSQAEAQPLGILVFENGEDRLVITEGGKERVQEGSILRVPATGEPHTVNVHVSRIMGAGDYVVTVTPKDENIATVTVAKGDRVEVSRDFSKGGNFVLQVPRLPQYVASLTSGFPPLGYGRAGRWRLRSVPSGAQVKVVDQVVATDVDVARLEPDYVRGVTFTMPGFRPCSFADARLSEETSAGKSWTVVTCVMKK